MEMQDLEEFREALELMEVPDLTLPDTGRPSAAFRQLVPFVPFYITGLSPICNDTRSCMVVCAPPFSPCRGPYIPARHAQSPYAPPYPSLLHTVVFRSDTDLAARCRTTDHQSVRQTRCKRWRIGKQQIAIVLPPGGLLRNAAVDCSRWCTQLPLALVEQRCCCRAAFIGGCIGTGLPCRWLSGACTINRPCAQQYVGKSQSCMVISGRLIVHAPVVSTR